MNLDKYTEKVRHKKVDPEELDPYILENAQVLTKIYGKGLMNKLNLDFLQKEIEPFYPFFQKRSQGINQWQLEKIIFNQTMRFNLEIGTNILEDKQRQFFSCFAMGLLSHPHNITPNSVNRSQVELEFLINNTLFNLKRNGNNLESVELNQKLYRNLTEVQNQIALHLNINHFSKRKTTFGLNAFDNVILIDLDRQPRYFEEKERMFLFGTPEIRGKLHIHNILKITAEHYTEKVQKIQDRINTMRSEIVSLQIVNKEKIAEKEFIEGELQNLGLVEKTMDQIEKKYSEKIRERSIYERQLELHEKRRESGSQKFSSSMEPLLDKVRKLNDRINELQSQIERLEREKTNLFNQRDDLKKLETNLMGEISKGRVCYTCGAHINESIAENRARNGKCPICDNIPPDQAGRKTKLDRLDQDIKNSRQRDEEIEKELAVLRSRLEIHEMQSQSLQRIIKESNEKIATENSDEIHYSIVEASQKLTEVINFINNIETIRSWIPRITYLDKSISQNNSRIEEDKQIIKSYQKRLGRLEGIRDTITARLKNILNECRNSFNINARKLGIALGEIMGRFVSQFSPEQLDKKQDTLMNLNYLDVIRSLNQPNDSSSTRLFYFISLLEMSLKGFFTMPNLYIIKGLTIEDLNKFREIFAQLNQNYQDKFQIIFLIKGDLSSESRLAPWYRSSREVRNPHQRTLLPC